MGVEVETTRARWRRRRPAGRAATLIEYVLLLSLFSVGVLYSLDLVNEQIEAETSETAHEIGGVGGTTTTTTTTTLPGTGTGGSTTSTTSTTMPVNTAPVVWAGPDITISPSNTTWTTQNGTMSDSDTPAHLLDVTWTSWTPSNLSIRNLVRSGGDTSIEVRGTRPGTYWLGLSASDGFLTAQDWALVKVSSGIVGVSGFSVTGWWTDHQLLSWNAQGYFRVTNQFGHPVQSLTVAARWTYSNGGTENVSCTTNSNGECWITKNSISSQISSACLALVNVTGPAGCFDGWNNAARDGCVQRAALVVPTTTTTTTRPPTTTTSSTSTTRPPTTTTTTTRPPTTTTTTSSTTTTRPPPTTTTRPPTTTTTTTIAL